MPGGWDQVEFPCIWIPDGAPVPPLPWGNPVLFRAIFIPDGYEGSRPGYPWVEFGRMTLARTTAAAAGSGAPHRRKPADATPSIWSATVSSVPVEPLASARSDEARGPGGWGSRGHSLSHYLDVRATMRLRDVTYNAKAALAGLEATSASNPVLRSWSKGKRVRDSSETTGNEEGAEAHPDSAVLRAQS